MKNRLLILILMTAFAGNISAQKIITLRECYDRAASSNAIAGEKDAYGEISEIKNSNLSKSWLPSLDANASASYMSDVVDFKNAMASNPALASMLTPMPHDQYKLTLDINQVIYDGGAIKSGKAMEEAELNVNRKQTETDLYKLRSQVNGYYYNLLLLERQKELLTNYLTLINKKIESIQSGISSGAVLKSDADVLASEKLKLEQQLTENGLRRTALLKNLAELTGMEIEDNSEFVLPEAPAELTGELNRPELQLFDMRRNQLSAGLMMSQSKRMPKIFGFATLGYGNPPGNDFFNNKFDTYYFVGGGIKWNIFDWNRVKNEKKVITLQQGIIENRKKDLETNLNMQLQTKTAEISSLKTLLNTDTELISLRKRITATAGSQYANGTITATEYLNELNAEHQAEINYEIHRINLSMAMTEYLNISGKDLE